MKNGEMVRRFEEAFAEYVGARYCIALCNGTSTLHTALVALGVKPGDRVAVPPLTMSATTIAVLHAGAVPVFCDVDPDTWLLGEDAVDRYKEFVAVVPVSLYGLVDPQWDGRGVVTDAAQTLAKWSHVGNQGFVSWSFQASKILALGEGGMLATNSEDLATRAREFSSLGYRMRADQPRILPATLKHPSFERHHTYPAWNYRLNDLTAEEGYWTLKGGGMYGEGVRGCLARRQTAASLYREAISGCDWIEPQHVPEGWTHDYWTFAVALESAELWEPFVAAIEHHGGERPYAAWRLTYHERPFVYLADVVERGEYRGEAGGLPMGICPVAESLQPRLVQGQTNNLASAERNAGAWHRAILEVGGQR